MMKYVHFISAVLVAALLTGCGTKGEEAVWVAVGAILGAAVGG